MRPKIVVLRSRILCLLAAAWLSLGAHSPAVFAGPNRSLRARLSVASERLFVPPSVKQLPTLPPQISLPEIRPTPAPQPLASAAPDGTPEKKTAPQTGEQSLRFLQDQPQRTGEAFDGVRKPKASGFNSGSALEAPVLAVGQNIDRQLSQMEAVLGDGQAPLLRLMGKNAHHLLKQIDVHLKNKAIDPRIAIRTDEADPPVPILDRRLKVGIYPVAADPFHWAHLLIGLQAVARLQLDKIVYIVGGDDPRKPQLTKANIRHPMDQAVLEGFKPFFAYSPIALGTNLDGETNLFRILALNAAQNLQAFYIVGDDHYRLKDKNGNDDTIPKIERNRLDPKLGFNPERHEVSLAFNERVGLGEKVPTNLAVHILPKMEFEASSSQVKEGEHVLMPFSAYDYVRKNKLGLYGIPSDGAK